MQHPPSGGAGRGVAVGGSAGPLSIGAVLHVLRAEFPDVTVSKIRFLEAEGLVEPKRSPSGYRKFGSGDIDRLGYVLRMQRDHYLPLKVIKEHLDALGRGERPELPLPAPSAPQAAPEPDAAVSEPDPAVPEAYGVRLGRPELLAAAEVAEDDLAAWESCGLIVPDSRGEYDLEAVTLCRLVAELGRHGLDARHLRPVKAAADRQADRIERVVAPLRRNQNPRVRAEAEAEARELERLSARLHAVFVRSAMRPRPGGTGPDQPPA